MTKRFDSILAVDHISATIRTGSVFGLIGTNGAGTVSYTHLRKAVFGVNFAVLGLENQEKLDYRLPLRVLGYEVGAYEHQAAEIYREIRRSGRNSDTELSSGEYLYGFRKSDRLHPVITIILYYGCLLYTSGKCPKNNRNKV